MDAKSLQEDLKSYECNPSLDKLEKERKVEDEELAHKMTK